MLTLFTAFVQPSAEADPLQFFKAFELGIAAQGEVTQANRVAGSDDILFAFRLGPRAHAVHSRGLVYAAESRIVNLTLAKPGEGPSEEAFFDAIRGIELRGVDGWVAPWQLRPPQKGQALPGYGVDRASEEDDPFQDVRCDPGRHPLLWATPTARGGQLYLFGSMHLGHPSFYPFARPVEAAFAGSDRLVVEVDVSATGETEMAEQMLGIGSLAPGQVLSDVISPELYERLAEVAAELNLPAATFDAMSPGAVGLVLSMMRLMSRGFSPADGVEQYFLGRSEGKTIVELETIAQQFALIESFGAPFLRATLDGMETVDEDLDALYRSWRCGDEAGLAQVVIGLGRERANTAEELEFVEEFNEVFLFGRNQEMTMTILDLLDEEGDSFVLVGTAHLVGERGIPTLLRDAGHEVRIVAP